MISHPQHIMKGTILKVELHFSNPCYPQLTLDDIDYKVQFYCDRKVPFEVSKQSVVVEKIGEVKHWYAYVDTNITNVGKLSIKLIANLPDLQYVSGKRTEIIESLTDITIW